MYPMLAQRSRAPSRFGLGPPRSAMGPSSSIDCALAVAQPVDVAPIRSPQAVHTILARRFANRSITEIGTRNGDGMACFAQVARMAVAIEIEAAYCTKLRARAAKLQSQASGNFEVACGSYEKQPAIANADFVTWWQMWPRLTNDKVLRVLRKLHAADARSTKSQAVVLFDLGWPTDRQSWKRLQSEAVWNQKVPYDEHSLCINGSSVVRPHGPKLCARARGAFMIAGIPLGRGANTSSAKRQLADGAPSAAVAAATPASSLSNSTTPSEPSPSNTSDHVPPGLRHAVCLTGLERDFSTIAVNIREFLFRFLGTPDAEITFFGVQPSNDKWQSVNRMLPLHVVETHRGMCIDHYATEKQRDSLRSLIHCSNHGRTNCHAGFPFELCSLSQCESMIDAFERKHGRRFHTVYRLRADLSFELPLRFPWPLQPQAIYVPFMNDGGGINDQAAFGERAAMRRYLTRHRYLVPNITVPGLQKLLPYKLTLLANNKISTEMFLKAAMYRDGISVIRVRRWMYCTHNFKAMLDRAAVRGCIGRVRQRTHCDALVCPRTGIKYWCTCHRNATCSAIAAGKPVANVGPGESSKYNRSRRDALKHRLASCIDVRGDQLRMRSCTAFGKTPTSKQAKKDKQVNPGCDEKGPCDLRSSPNDTHILSAGTPRCIFESGVRLNTTSEMVAV